MGSREMESLLDDEVKDIESNAETEGLDDTQTTGDLHEDSNPSTSLEKFCGSKRLHAMTAWMNTVDDALVRLGKDVENLIENQANQEAQMLKLERRKREAIQGKAELEAEVLKEIKRVRVAEETAMTRKRLQDAGIAQEEIDAILPVIPHVG